MMYGQPIYPRVNSGGHTVVPPTGRHPSNHQTSSPSGLGIRVALKQEYRITPPPQLAPQMGEIPRSNFQFDFEFEKKLLVDSEKDSQYWTKLGMENLPSKPPTGPTPPPPGPAVDSVAAKYIASGLSREAVPLAVANYGDNPTKVREFANGFALLREMGFAPNRIAEVLIMFDNDTDKALAHFLNNSS